MQHRMDQFGQRFDCGVAAAPPGQAPQRGGDSARAGLYGPVFVFAGAAVSDAGLIHIRLDPAPDTDRAQPEPDSGEAQGAQQAAARHGNRDAVAVLPVGHAVEQGADQPPPLLSCQSRPEEQAGQVVLRERVVPGHLDEGRAQPRVGGGFAAAGQSRIRFRMLLRPCRFRARCALRFLLAVLALVLPAVPFLLPPYRLGDACLIAGGPLGHVRHPGQEFVARVLLRLASQIRCPPSGFAGIPGDSIGLGLRPRHLPHPLVHVAVLCRAPLGLLGEPALEPVVRIGVGFAACLFGAHGRVVLELFCPIEVLRALILGRLGHTAQPVGDLGELAGVPFCLHGQLVFQPTVRVGLRGGARSGCSLCGFVCCLLFGCVGVGGVLADVEVVGGLGDGGVGGGEVVDREALVPDCGAGGCGFGVGAAGELGEGGAWAVSGGPFVAGLAAGVVGHLFAVEVEGVCAVGVVVLVGECGAVCADAVAVDGGALVQDPGGGALAGGDECVGDGGVGGGGCAGAESV